MEKVVIAGAGVAGLTAAIYAARAKLNPVVVEGMQPGGQLAITNDVENFPGFPDGIAGPVLMDMMRKQAERLGARFIPGEIVEAHLQTPFHLKLTSGEVLKTITLIIATGASAQYLGLESEQKLIGRGVSACATCDGAFFSDVPVAVIGGGDTAMEEALFLTRFASKVYIIHRRDQLRASKIMADRALSNSKIEVIWDSVVEEVLDVEKGEVTGVRLKNVKTNEVSELMVSGIFIAIGHKPNTAPFVGQLDMDERGYLLPQNGVRMNISGVFAAGDVADNRYRQAITAAGSGCKAAIEAERYLEKQNA